MPEHSTHYVRPLPEQPDLEKQRKLAKALVRDIVCGDADALARVRALHPSAPAPEAFALSDAQLVIARGYGFASWSKLKHKIEALTKTRRDRFVDAVRAGEVEPVRNLLDEHPELAQRINEPLFDFGQRAVLIAATNLPLLDLLLAHGADINARSQWEHGGFGILEGVTPEEAEPLLARGARMTIWAAAHLGRLEALRALIDADTTLANAKGGDGKRPLHFARSVPIAALLLDRGAEIDALDDDHNSTPAQHLVGDRPELARFLVARGAKTDLLMACALGDVALVRKHLDADPGAIRMRVSSAWLPMIDTAENGGHIYQWTLGFFLSAFQIAQKFGHADVLDLLRQRAGPRELLLDALWNGGDAGTVPIAALDEEALNQVADAARQNDLRALLAMLARGFPVTATSQHGATPLHFAAFHGNPAMARAVLAYDPPLEVRDRDFDSPPLGWAIHGAANGWPGISTGEHGACVQLLLAAGAACPEGVLPTGDEAIDRVLRAHLLSAS